jgi:titin
MHRRIQWLVSMIPGIVGVALLACENRDPLAPSFAVAKGGVAAPSNLALTVASYHQIWFAWQDNASSESGYEVWRSTTGPAGTFTLFTTYPWANTTQGGNDLLEPSTQYCYKVRAYSTLGQSGKIGAYSSFSNTACATTPALPVPAPPTGVRIVVQWPSSWASYYAADVSWTNSVSQTDSTRLERAAQVAGPWQRVATFTPSYYPNATWWRDAPIAAEQRVCYRLIAFNQWGASSASNAPCTVPIAPPTDLLAVSNDGHSATLTWKDNSAYEDGYVLSRGPDGITWTMIADLPPNATSYNDANIALDTRYAYRVQGKKDGNLSAQAGPVWFAIASGPPLAPTDVSAYPSNSWEVSIGWNSPSVTATSFRVERSTDRQSTWQLAGTTTEPYLHDGQRLAEQEVCYRVYAINSYGESPASPVDCTIPPAGPTNVAVTLQADGSQLVSWTDNSSVEDGYIVFVLSPPCVPNGVDCFYYCNDSGCSYWQCYPGDECGPVGYVYRSYDLPANATSQLIDGLDVLDAVYATRDGGGSDAGTLASGPMAGVRLSPSMRASSAMRQRPPAPVRNAPHRAAERP